jgi:MFS family permease
VLSIASASAVLIASPGTYQAYYETGILANSSPSDISWIGSIQAFLLMFVGAITGSIYDAGYVHSLMLVGSFLVVFGQMMLSLATSYYQVVLAQAICIGIGCGCLFVPGVAILSTYFSTKIATAMGLAASGSSLGGVIYPIVFHRLQPTIGFPWATRVIGFIALFGLAIANLTLRVRTVPDSRRKFLDLPAFKEPAYALFVLGSFLGFMGLYVVFFYVQTYAIQTNITNDNMAFYLLSVLNAGSVFGRIIPNFIADRTGPLNMIIPCAMLSGVLALCLIAAHSLAPVIVICALYGFFSGSFVSLPPTILVHLTPNRAMIGTRMGMCFSGMCSCNAFSYLVQPSKLTKYYSRLYRLANRDSNLRPDLERNRIPPNLGVWRCARHCGIFGHRRFKSRKRWLGFDGQGLACPGNGVDFDFAFLAN